MIIGDRVPNFTATDQSGVEVDLDQLRGDGAAVVFFYPKAFTPGCTAESCHFRDLASEFAEVGATRIGISADPVDKLARFDDENSLGFPLLSDGDRTVAKIFGVKRPGPIFNKRHTFVIGRDGTLLASIASEFKMEQHADEALSALREAVSTGG